jgi:hypothetical protein
MRYQRFTQANCALNFAAAALLLTFSGKLKGSPINH